MSLLRFRLGATRLHSYLSSYIAIADLEITNVFSHAAYAASTHGLFGHWSYLMHRSTNPGFIAAIGGCYSVPALFGHPLCSPIERDLYALLVHQLGSLGLMNRPRPIMLKSLLIMLLSSAQKLCPLFSI